MNSDLVVLILPILSSLQGEVTNRYLFVKKKVVVGTLKKCGLWIFQSCPGFFVAKENEKNIE